MGEDFSPTLLSWKSYSPTRRAGWGLSPRLSTVELIRRKEDLFGVDSVSRFFRRFGIGNDLREQRPSEHPKNAG